MSYPYIATTEDGTKYTPQQGKIAIDKEFFIGPVQVIPAVGEKNRAHWRGLNNEPYLREFDHSGYEMSLWHSQQQIAAADMGFEIEHKIETPMFKYYADAFDKKTNTVIEYVHTCFDKNKVQHYILCGFNQRWVFNGRKESKMKGDFRLVKFMMDKMSTYNKLVGTNLTIEAQYR